MAKVSTWYWVLNDISKNNAGLTIRTQPIINELQKSFSKVSVISFDAVNKATLGRRTPEGARGFIFSKPSNSHTLLLIKSLRQKGYPVIIDLFDNYFAFSEWSCERGLPWILLHTLYSVDAVIVSTPVIERWVKRLHPDLRQIRVCDPLPWSKDAVSMIGRHKKWQEKSSMRKLLWFGIGSNPYYRAGLVDLIDWLPQIQKLYEKRPLGTELELVICSNPVPEAQQAVLRYKQAGIPVRFVPWSQETCAAELDAASCVLIPTGKSEFVRAKTHNRLSDAIHHACLVFTTSVGPYEDYIGGSVQTTIPAIQQLLFNVDSLNIHKAFEQSIAILEKNNPFEQQVSDLSFALENVYMASERARLDLKKFDYNFIIMGCRTVGGVVKTARKLDYLIVGYERNYISVNFDIFLQGVDSKLQVAYLICSNKGKVALESMGVQLKPEDEDNLFSLGLSLESVDMLAKLENYLSLECFHDEINVPISELSVRLLLNILRDHRVDIFLADDYGFCSPIFVTHYAKYLESPARALEAIWKETGDV